MNYKNLIYGKRLKDKEINNLIDNFFNEYNFKKNIENYGIFITIEKHNELRGCIGTFILQKNVARAIAKYTLLSAFNDYRFKPIEKEELNYLTYKINFLDRPLELKTINVNEIKDKMIFGREKGHGITIYFDNGLNATYLSSVLPDHLNIFDKESLVMNWENLVNSLKEKSSNTKEINIKRIEIYLCREFNENEILNLNGGSKYYYKINYKNNYL